MFDWILNTPLELAGFWNTKVSQNLNNFLCVEKPSQTPMMENFCR